MTSKKKLYKKILKAFGGCALYLDKCILQALDVNYGDEVVIEVCEGIITITKPKIDNNKIKAIIDKIHGK